MTCWSCGFEAVGYSKRDLLEDGWKWHDASAGVMFVMCGDCERLFASRRATREKVA